ncbi:MAG: DUF3093 domain-containing protein [Arachnia sp.]
MAYEERLRVPVVWWLLALAFVGTIAVVMAAYLEWWVAVVVGGLVGGGVLAVLGSYGGLAIAVSDDDLRVGPNRLGAAYIGTVEALSGADAARALGPAADHRDFLRTRPYIEGLVKIQVDDPADPHPYWLISSRHPDRLGAAVTAIAGGPR